MLLVANHQDAEKIHIFQRAFAEKFRVLVTVGSDLGLGLQAAYRATNKCEAESNTTVERCMGLQCRSVQTNVRGNCGESSDGGGGSGET